MPAAKRKPGRPAPPPPRPVDPGPCDLRADDMGAEGLLDLRAAAKFLGGISVKTVRRMIGRGELPVRRVGHGRGRVTVPLAALKLYAGAAART